MSSAYSTYEAKTRFSEVMRKVRRGQRVVVTYHGEPIAEISPVARGASGLRARLAELEARGEIVPAEGDFKTFQPVARRPGALRRFLRDRG
jgi:prevent-host-death family protein